MTPNKSPSDELPLPSLFYVATIGAMLLGAADARAVMILPSPAFAPSTNAPLAGLLKVNTDVDSRVSVVVNDGTETWQRNFFDYSTNHDEVLLGFKPNRTNQIQVIVFDKDRNTYTNSQALTFITAPLPSNFPHSTVLKSEPSKMEPGYTLFIINYGFGMHTYITMMDSSGEVVWYSPTPQAADADVRQLDNGDLFIEEGAPKNDFIELNMLGQTVKTLTAPAEYPVNSHDGFVTDHGTILYLSDVSQAVSNFPANITEPNPPLETTNIDDNPVVEISATNGDLLNVWSPLNFLDPTRVTYLTSYSFSQSGVDNEHANAVLEDTNDDSIVVSFRNQNAVVKIARSGQLKWILGSPTNWGAAWQQKLLTPVGSPFEWNYGQHAPELTPQDTLLVYDDGNERADLFDPPVPDQDNYSRAVEYSINEMSMKVSQVWDSSRATNDDRLFTPIIGDADQLPKTKNVLVTYGYVTYVNGVHPSSYAPGATMVRIKEYTHDPVPEVVFDLSFFDYNNTSPGYYGYVCYRSDRVPDLYGHPAEEIANLKMILQNGKPLLEFSADPPFTYEIESSPDMVNWTQRGAAAADDPNGDFSFHGLPISGFTDKFYRVITQ